MSEELSCAECGSPIPENAPEGCCPPCLLSLASAFLNDDEVTVKDTTIREFPGSTFGNYEILEKIGEGGMGVVYKARQGELGRTVAVKMIRSGPLASEAEVQRFRSEAQAAASLQHKNVVAIHEISEHEGRLFFSMNYIEGESLAATVRRNTLSAERAAQYVKIAAEAVQYAHEKGILHRDIKPANLLIDADDQLHITDFGLAKHLNIESDFTASGEIMGTPNYTPPEQAEGRRGDMGPASDVYSLGATLYDLLAGRPPFRGETPLDTLRQVIDTEPVSPRLLNVKVPRDLETICLKCLAKKPQQRYESAQELAEELDRFLNREPIHARPVSTLTRACRWAQRKPLFAGVTSLLLLMFVLIGVASFKFRLNMLLANESLATQIADNIHDDLDDLKNAVAEEGRRLGERQDIESLMQSKNTTLHGILESLQDKYASRRTWMGTKPFNNWNVFDNEGNMVNRSTSGIVERNLSGRHWFELATRDRDSANENPGPYVSKAFYSWSDGLDKFGISVPITVNPEQGEKSRIIGVLLATVTTPPTRKNNTSQHNSILIAATDPSLSDKPQSNFKMLGLSGANSTKDIDELPFKEVPGSRGFYIDPASRFLNGPWLAGYDKVPDTYFWVVVQTSDWVIRALVIAAGLGMGAGTAYLMWRLALRRLD